MVKSPRADRTRAEEIIRSVRSDTRHRFEAERMPPRSDSTTIADMQASEGAARASRPAHESGYAVFGPWIDLDPRGLSSAGGHWLPDIRQALSA